SLCAPARVGNGAVIAVSNHCCAISRRTRDAAAAYHLLRQALMINTKTTPIRTPGKPPFGTPPRGGATPNDPLGKGMPPRRVWLWCGLILLLNFVLSRMLYPGPET